MNIENGEHQSEKRRAYVAPQLQMIDIRRDTQTGAFNVSEVLDQIGPTAS